jgi:serine/threonine protein phosphatase 1
MTTWIVGDIHGCATELCKLIEQLALGDGDQLVSCGDLFHRGPDPAGVMDALRSANALFILGNHERAVLRRMALAPLSGDASDRPPLREDFPPIEPEDLAGDGGRPCHVEESRRRDILVFLQGHSGYYLRNTDINGAGLTRDGRPWRVVHAGIDPRKPIEKNSPFELTRTRRLDCRGKPWWFERYEGKELILFGHSSSRLPIAHRSKRHLLSLGIDTACVYGGALTAYSPELDQFVRIPAERDYTRRVLAA